MHLGWRSKVLALAALLDHGAEPRKLKSVISEDVRVSGASAIVASANMAVGAQFGELELLVGFEAEKSSAKDGKGARIRRSLKTRARTRPPSKAGH